MSQPSLYQCQPDLNKYIAESENVSECSGTGWTNCSFCKFRPNMSILLDTMVFNG